LEGRQVGELHGHENFIYSLAALPSGELVSSSEDRTVRIWRGNECVQTITHPAISVWSVAVCRDNGDIVTGASDKIVRVFTRSPDRIAEPATLKAFEELVQTSLIPLQPLGDINKTDLPGPDFLQQKSGTKEGQVQLIKERNGNVSAYQWSSAANQWLSVGTVVDAAGNASKVSYNGKDYDYVFDVDIEEGKPALKLPYNASQNPYEVAQKFIVDNELPISYIDQVANFIIQNSQGTSLGPNPNQGSGSAPGSDPWGMESRYRPNDAQQAPAPEPAAQKTLPQRTYLAISTGNHKMILKKIDEFNQQLLEDGRKDLTLNADDMKALSRTITQLEPVAGKQEATLETDAQSVNAAVRGATEWPPDKRLPWLDFLRLLTAASTSAVSQISDGTEQTLVTRLAASEVFSSSAPVNNTMLATRTLANLFCSGSGRCLAESAFDQILELVAPHASTQNKNLIIALTTLYINFAVLLTSSSAPGKDGAVEHEPLPSSDTAASADLAITLLDTLTSVLNSTSEPEALYRALVAAGTVLSLGKDFADVAKEGLGIEEAIARAESVGKEPRIKKLVGEIRSAIGS
jgi:phospholipase A-2-activating protein